MNDITERRRLEKHDVWRAIAVCFTIVATVLGVAAAQSSRMATVEEKVQSIGYKVETLDSRTYTDGQTMSEMRGELRVISKTLERISTQLGTNK